MLCSVFAPTRSRLKRPYRLSTLWLTISSLLLLSCKGTTTEVEPDLEHNPVAPTANALVSGHHVGGDPAGQSSIYGMFESDNRTWLAHGLDNEIHNVIRLAADGSPLWTSRVLSYSIRGMTPISAPWLPLGAVTVGTFDIDDDGAHDASRVTVWGPDGALLDEVVLTGGGLRRFAGGVVVAENAADRVDLLIVGSADQDGGSFSAWTACVSFRSDSTLVRDSERTYPALNLCHLRPVVHDSTHSVFYVGGNAYENESTLANALVVQLSDSLDVDWRTNLISTTGLPTGIGGPQAIGWTGTNIIAVGFADAEKATRPSDGYWEAGLVASLSSNGSLEWMRSLSLSEKGDRFVACTVDGSFVYAAGYAAQFVYTKSQRSFGYGLVTKLHAMTGEIVAHYTFGDPSYRSGFNSIVVHGDQAWCAGFTEEDTFNQFRSWFVELDFLRPITLSAVAGRPTSEVPNTTRPSEFSPSPWSADSREAQ